jgi:hypothetical protein
MAGQKDLFDVESSEKLVKVLNQIIYGKVVG